MSWLTPLTLSSCREPSWWGSQSFLWKHDNSWNNWNSNYNHINDSLLKSVSSSSSLSPRCPSYCVALWRHLLVVSTENYMWRRVNLTQLLLSPVSGPLLTLIFATLPSAADMIQLSWVSQFISTPQLITSNMYKHNTIWGLVKMGETYVRLREIELARKMYTVQVFHVALQC